MKTSHILILAGLSLPAFSQSIQKLDPALDHLVPANASVRKVAGGFNKWTEGPVWTPENTLLFAEIPANNIMEWRPDRGASVFLHPSGYTGSAPYGGPEPGSNGMALDSRGRVTVAGHARRNVWRFETPNPKGQITVLADSFDGKPFNSPNDLVNKSDGSLYFTDPPYGLPTQSDDDPARQQPVNGVYRIAGARDQKPGTPPDPSRVKLVIRDLSRPNGIALSPDEKTLYVSNSGSPKVWMKYRIAADGSLAGGAVLFDASKERGPGGPDGIKVDREGNIYGPGPGGVWVISPDGRHLGTIQVPERVGNVAFGDADGKTLYIAASTSIYAIQLSVAGLKR